MNVDQYGQVVHSYKGYDLVLEEFDDDDGFVKNHYTLCKNDVVIREVRQADGRSFCYTQVGLIDRFEQMVDLIIDIKRYMKLPAGFDGTPVYEVKK